MEPEINQVPIPVSSNSETPRYVGFWKRFLAYWVDGLILGIINVPLSLSLNAYNFTNLTNFSNPTNHSTVNPTASLIGLGIGIAYFVFFWVHENGQTLGHRLLAIRVVREDGKPIDIGTAIVRYIGYIISSLVLLLGFLWIAWDPKKQGWHDKMARTVVVKTDGKSHTAIAVTLFVIPFIFLFLLFIGLIIGGIFLASRIGQNSESYPKAIFDATNTYRTAHQLALITEDETICAYVQKRLGELESKKNSNVISNGFTFDDHQGFIEDLASPQLHDAYFSNFGPATEFYGHTETSSLAVQTVNGWMNLKDSQLKDPNYTFGCVRADNIYTVFIIATAPQVTPTPVVYTNTQQNNTGSAIYPTFPPYATPTLSAAAQAQLTGFQQEYNNAKATIDQSQQGPH